MGGGSSSGRRSAGSGRRIGSIDPVEVLYDPEPSPMRPSSGRSVRSGCSPESCPRSAWVSPASSSLAVCLRLRREEHKTIAGRTGAAAGGTAGRRLQRSEIDVEGRSGVPRHPVLAGWAPPVPDHLPGGAIRRRASPTSSRASPSGSTRRTTSGRRSTSTSAPRSRRFTTWIRPSSHGSRTDEARDVPSHVGHFTRPGFRGSPPAFARGRGEAGSERRGGRDPAERRS